jgi:integral membrane protein
MSNRTQSTLKLLTWTHRIGIWEGISYLLLLFVAMPLKYGMGYSQAVRLTGSLHGFLFVGFIAMLYYALLTDAISRKAFVRAILLSLLPFGTFYLSFDKSVN